MSKEMLKPDDLERDREILQSKVAKIRAAKNKDIEDRILIMEKRRDETKNLEVIYKEAQENFQYYDELDRAGQLPEDEQENFKKTKELISQIEAKMAEHDETAKNTMAIPAVKEKVRAEADEINKRIDDEKAEKEKCKNIEAKLSDLIDRIVAEVEKLKKSQEEKRVEWKNARNELFKTVADKLDNKLIKDLESKFYINTPVEEFKNTLLQYKESLGFFNFNKRNLINKILNSQELAKVENIREDYMRDGSLNLGFSQYQYLKYFIDKEEYRAEFDELSKLSREEPWVNFLYTVEKVLNNKGIRAIRAEDI